MAGAAGNATLPTPDVVFRQLGKDFAFEDVVVEHLVTQGLQSLEEFRFLWHQESQVETWLTQVKVTNATLQASRLRRAWHSVRLQADAWERDQSRASVQDLDDPLADSDLSDLKTTFWRRYKQVFPPEVHPADVLISRVARECTKRMLMVTTSRKRQKLGENLYTDSQEEVQPAHRDVGGYLARLYTYLLAPCRDAGPHLAGAAGHAGAGARQSQRPLGDIIKEVMQQRDAHWMTEKLRLEPFPPAPPLSLKSEKAKDFPAKDQVAGKPLKLVSNTGERLCKEYQHGRCSATNCKKGVDRCAVQLRNGKACYQTHPAVQ